MKTQLYQFGVVALTAAGLIIFPNCGVGGIAGVKVTGDGTIEGPSGHKATFSVQGASCDYPQPPTGKMTYSDKHAPGFAQNGGLQLDGTMMEVLQCNKPEGCTDPSAVIPGNCPYQKGYLVEVGYKSTNPKIPGSGIAGACLVDNGDAKKKSGDLLGFGITSGPYAGYFIQGTIKGNIQSQLCQ